MGFWDKVKGQFIEVIEWTEDASDVLVSRFPVAGNEIKMGAKLTVRETQNALFVNEGKTADLFAPGLYELSTKNLPILTTLRSWPYGFQSPFKAEVYFFNMRQFNDVKWGTSNPITVRDPEFGMARIRAFGNVSFSIQDPKKFFAISGTRERTVVEDVAGQLRTTIVNRFSDLLADSKIPFLDQASKLMETSQRCAELLKPDFTELGIVLHRFLIENLSLPPEVEKVLDARTSMGVVGNTQAYAQFQAADSIKAAAENTGGIAGAGVGMGAGMAMGQMFQQSLAGNAASAKRACVKCQKPMDATAKFCPECGAPQAEKPA